MRTVNAKKGCVIPLGRLGENEATVVVFDIREWIKCFGNGTFQLLNQRNGDPAAYPCVISQTETEVRWEVKNSDVSQVGYGKCQLTFFVGDTVAKTEIWTTVVGTALTGGGDVPEPWEDWAQRVLEAADRAESAADRAEEAAKIAGNFLSLTRKAPYLYEVTYDTIPEFTEAETTIPGGCSSFVRGGKLYTNLDWGYAETAEFQIETRDFSGMAFLDDINDGELNGKYERIGQLPYHVRDGVNNYGIMVSSHILFNDFDYAGSGEKNVPVYTLPYLILSNVKSINALSSVVSPYLENLKIPSQLSEMEYLLQFMVTDGTTTYAILPGDDGYEVVDITANPKLTNFRWVPEAIVNRADLQLRPTGVERWNAIGSNTTLEDLRFTLAYQSPTRLSEFIGIDGTTKDSADAELLAIYNRARAEYLTRQRDGKTWQTMHSIVYSPTGIESLYTQEDYSEDRVQKSGASTWDEVADKPFESVGQNLKVIGGALTVETAPNVEEDNTKPITSAAVFVEVGNINALLELI